MKPRPPIDILEARSTCCDDKVIQKGNKLECMRCGDECEARQSEMSTPTGHERALPAKAGHFRSLIKQKSVENANLGEVQKTLSEQVKSLWKMVALLEWRKNELEGYIKSMEGYLMRGSDVVDTFNFEPSEEMPLK